MQRVGKYANSLLPEAQLRGRRRTATTGSTTVVYSAFRGIEAVCPHWKRLLLRTSFRGAEFRASLGRDRLLSGLTKSFFCPLRVLDRLLADLQSLD